MSMNMYFLIQIGHNTLTRCPELAKYALLAKTMVLSQSSNFRQSTILYMEHLGRFFTLNHAVCDHLVWRKCSLLFVPDAVFLNRF